MSDLFDENECWTDDSNKIFDEFSSIIEPLIKKYMEKGYKLRELEIILYGAVSNNILREIVNKRRNKSNDITK